jgi:hypothetical protein
MRKALLVGINYPGTAAELRGCVNDVLLMQDIITKQYQFDEVKVVTDNDATTSRILRELDILVNNAKPGDYLYFHFSGHGVQMPSTVGAEDGLDECICPSDFNWRQLMIRDHQMKKIFDRVPRGANFLVILDSCHSGHSLNQDNQYQPFGLARMMGMEDTPRTFPGMPDHIREEIEKRRKGVGARSIQSLDRSVNLVGLLLATSQSHQTAADAWISGRWIGAGTHHIAECLARYDYKVDYKTLVDEINTTLMQSRFSQRPELNGPAGLFANPVFGTRNTSPVDSLPEEVIHYSPEQPLPPEKQKKDNPIKQLINFILRLFGLKR